MSKIIEVTTKKELKFLYDHSALTWEGLLPEDFEEAMCIAGGNSNDEITGYHITGKVMNELCELTGTNAYPNDVNIFSVYPTNVLAMLVGARWFDDIVANNDARENRGYNYHNGESILDK